MTKLSQIMGHRKLGGQWEKCIMVEGLYVGKSGLEVSKFSCMCDLLKVQES